MKLRKAVSILLMFSVMVFFCGFLFDTVTVLVDTDKNHVYEYISADELLSDFAADHDAAARRYKDGYYIISGRIESISQRGDTLMIAGASVADKHIICACPKSLRPQVQKLSAGASLGAYGRITVDLLDREIHIQPDKLLSSASSFKKGSYYLLDGKSIDKNRMTARTLRNGSVNYRIPAAWKGVEHSIVDEELGTIEGYQYVLNRLPGNEDTVPESFFVCYFDNADRLENTDDRKETKLIEKAIINNISGEGKSDSFRSRDVTTYYGAKYNYYVGSYTDALATGNNGYHVEYIFQKNGDDGLVMYMYVYKNAKHLSDVLFVTRFLEM